MQNCSESSLWKVLLNLFDHLKHIYFQVWLINISRNSVPWNPRSADTNVIQLFHLAEVETKIDHNPSSKHFIISS